MALNSPSPNPYESPAAANVLPLAARGEDPVLTSARREAALVVAIWAVACACSVGVSYRLGYGRDVATLTYVLGFPDWIFWGVIVPWTVCTGLCFVVPRFVIKDVDLGEEKSEEEFRGGASEADHA